MGKKSTAILPQTKDILEKMGEQIKLARLRRGLSAEAVARDLLYIAREDEFGRKLQDLSLMAGKRARSGDRRRLFLK